MIEVGSMLADAMLLQARTIGQIGFGYGRSTGTVSMSGGQKAATAEVQDLVGKAVAILRDGFEEPVLNAAGAYHDPAARPGDLRVARQVLEEAFAILMAWPSES